MADYSTPFDKLETRIDTGLADGKAQITTLKGMHGIVIGGIASLIINTFFG